MHLSVNETRNSFVSYCGVFRASLSDQLASGLSSNLQAHFIQKMWFIESEHTYALVAWIMLEKLSWFLITRDFDPRPSGLGNMIRYFP